MSESRSDGIPFEYDTRFEEDLHKIKRSDSRKAGELISRCEAIRHNPFKGEWKRWAMDGLYGLHADPLVILYQLEPDLSPNNDSANIKSIYFWRVVHHDNQQTAVRNLDATSPTSEVEVRLYYADTPDLQVHVSKMYDADCVVVRGDKYDGEGVIVRCELTNTETAENELRELLPDAAEVAISRPSVSDVLD